MFTRGTQGLFSGVEGGKGWWIVGLVCSIVDRPTKLHDSRFPRHVIRSSMLDLISFRRILGLGTN